MSTDPAPIGRRLYRTIRTQLAEGALRAGDRMPSTRGLAADLGVSRSTVVAVYEQLAAEGYIETHPGARARVAPGVGMPERSATPAPRQAARAPRLSRYGQRIAAMALPRPPGAAEGDTEFLYGALAEHDFPARVWRRVHAQAMANRQSRLYYGAPEGEAELRVELRRYLRRARGLSCTPERILIVQGAQQALDLCARVLLDAGDRVVVEEPGYLMARRVFEAAASVVLPTPVDEHGLVTRALPRSKAALAYVTPSHQFPLGSVMSIARRGELLAWAQRHGAWIVEDDYDSEFRYGLRPIDTLHALDGSGTVIYVGTFSKALSPQLRLGYLVLPEGLVEPFRRAKQLTDRHAPRLEQVVLAELIRSGAYERHVRRIRRENERRRDALLEAVAAHLPGGARVEGTASGLHVVVWLPGIPVRAEPALVERARELGIGIWPITPLYARGRALRRHDCAGLVLGYSGLGPSEIGRGIERLGAAVRLERPTRPPGALRRTGR